MAYTQELVDAALRYQVYLERLKAGQLSRFDPVLRRAERRLRRLLTDLGPGPLNRLSRARFNRVVAEAVAILDDELLSFITGLRTDLSAVAIHGALFEAEVLDVATTVRIRVAPATDAQVAALMGTTPVQANGQVLDEFIDTWRSAARRHVSGALRVSYSQGQTSSEAVRQLRGTQARRNTNGVLTGKILRESQSATRTLTQHASAVGRHATRLGLADDLVRGYRWVSVMDLRTTIQCQSLDGRLFKIGAGPLPPIHFNCRSTTVADLRASGLVDPVTNIIRGTKRQAAHVTTYYEWLKTQSRAFQEDALGVTRAALFRKGGLSAEEFSRLNLDRNFEPLTLEEMRRKAPRAFKRAGL